jgi:hypothetical protein
MHPQKPADRAGNQAAGSAWRTRGIVGAEASDDEEDGRGGFRTCDLSRVKRDEDEDDVSPGQGKSF